MSDLATSLRLAVTGCDDSVTSAPSLNWPAIFRNSSARFCEVALIVQTTSRPAGIPPVENAPRLCRKVCSASSQLERRAMSQIEPPSAREFSHAEFAPLAASAYALSLIHISEPTRLGMIS